MAPRSGARTRVRVAAGGQGPGSGSRVLADPLVLPRRVVALGVAARLVDGGQLAGDLLAVRAQAARHLVGADEDLPPAARPLDPARGLGVVEREPPRRSRTGCAISMPSTPASDAYYVAEQALRWDNPAALNTIGSTLIRHLLRFGRPDAALAVFETPAHEHAPNFTMDSAPRPAHAGRIRRKHRAAKSSRALDAPGNAGFPPRDAEPT